MPLEPVNVYDEAQYPTLEEMAHRRRDFLRRVGLAAIAGAFGPHVLGCSPRGGRQEAEQHTRPSPTPVPATPVPATPATPYPPMPLAGAAPPPRWPGPRAAIVGDSPVAVRYADGVTGWVVVAVVFNPSNERLEAALLDAETRIAAVVREQLRHERSSFLADERRSRAAEAALLQSIRAIVGVGGLDSVSLAEVDAEAALPASLPALPPPPQAALAERLATRAAAPPPPWPRPR